MPGDRSCLVRYGVMSHVGRFSASRVGDTLLKRGQLVVVQTDRGMELGEILIVVDGTIAPADGRATDRTSTSSGDEFLLEGSVQSPSVLRLASADDILRSRHVDETRARRFALCERILNDSGWPWPVIDVEPLLDARATVLHYLGPHHVDVASIRARFRVECDFDVIFEPVGNDADGEDVSAADELEHSAAGGCGSCGCSSDGGCGSAPAQAPSRYVDQSEHGANDCSTESHSGCSSCGISRMRAEWNRERV